MENKKFYKRWWFWLGIVVVLFIVIGMSGSSSKPSKSVPAVAETGSSVAAPAQPAPAAQAAAIPQSLLKISGSGSKSTAKFTAAGDWDLNWSYDCSSFGYKGNFQVFVYNGDGSMSFSNAGVNQLGMSGADVEHYHSGGTFYLTINSECNWKIEAKG